MFELLLRSYLAFGQLIPQGQQEIVKHAGLQTIHANGAVTLRLKEVAREELTEAGARHVVVRQRDEYHPFEVVRHVRAWDDCDAVETWCEIRHDEKAPVRLVQMDSLAIQYPSVAKTVKVLSLTGNWAE
ncbi:MAG: hypothetical protein IJG13_13470, partial [Kiritimatiellae bacterium]|nr:hypothetical protein [Kiritimatiellia bacterium]